MAKRASVVIGANFGDEGKGLVTDFLSASAGSDTLVVRHNGGAQAGHTVVTPDGKRHVFHHFGSGTLAGASTFLSRFYVCNPLLFFKERPLLEHFGMDPVVYVDPRASVTTPYDMMINQIAEDTRGKDRHGSCGVGFGETVERTNYPAYSLSYQDLGDQDLVRKKLQSIRTDWLPSRLNTLGIKTLSEQWIARIKSDDIFERYMEEIDRFLQKTHRAEANILQTVKNVVFEGAQGLLLDQDRGWFPHVTRSNTGIKNASLLAKEAGFTSLEAVYISRAYNTRHGAGPLPHELGTLPYPGIRDKTNIAHPYQGTLRFAWLDLDLLSATIASDLKDCDSSLSVTPTLAITCLDQVDGPARYIMRGNLKTESIETFLDDTLKTTDISRSIISHGPSRDFVRKL